MERIVFEEFNCFFGFFLHRVRQMFQLLCKTRRGFYGINFHRRRSKNFAISSSDRRTTPLPSRNSFSPMRISSRSSSSEIICSSSSMIRKTYALMVIPSFLAFFFRALSFFGGMEMLRTERIVDEEVYYKCITDRKQKQGQSKGLHTDLKRGMSYVVCGIGKPHTTYLIPHTRHALYLPPKMFRRIDLLLLGITIVLTLFGLAMIASVSVFESYQITQRLYDVPSNSFYLWRSFLHVTVGMVVMLATTIIPYQ